MTRDPRSKREATKFTGLVTAGHFSGLRIGYAWAAATAPTRHKGLEVEARVSL